VTEPILPKQKFSSTLEPPVHSTTVVTAVPLLLDIHTLAALLTRSVASLERDQAAGRLPAPVRIGRSKKWRRSDIEAWVAAGCPARRAK
jgi:predicted DNA-binding transcriptional regulator AlpA